ncbi:oxidoreductase [Biscogniauxia mediterranea]|nr:oxidoreductase [Biscogniauxia mediterranea]
MPAFSGHVDFQPDKDIPSLEGKVILVTGGVSTAGLGKASIEALSRHGPAHIYFTSRNTKAAEALISRVKDINSQVALTFLETDFLSLASVKQACARFQHERLDILMWVITLKHVTELVTFAINYLAYGMIIQQPLPIMLKTAHITSADVRLVSLTSAGWRGHPRDDISFTNVMYATELARRHAEIMAVSVHPGVVNTDLVSTLPPAGRPLEEQGCFSQLWVAAGARRDELVNGGFYMPIGVLSNDKFDCTASSENLAGEIWKWTDEVLASF